jgi:Flp pilus assembly protein TadD
MLALRAYSSISSKENRLAKKTGRVKSQVRLSTGKDNLRDSENGSRRKAAQSATNAGRHDWLIAAALAVLTLVVYVQVINHQFINYDDDLYIHNNPVVIQGLTLKGVGWAFTTFHAGNWHPLTWLSHMLDVQLFGLSAGNHLMVNTLIHVATTLLLFFFLKRVTQARWESALVAALFALHPLHVESVAWAAERKDTLSTFLGLLTLLAYVRYSESTSWKRYAPVALTLMLGLMAKPMLVTWPFLLLLLDWWPLGRLEWKPTDGIKQLAKPLMPLIQEKIPLFCLVGASMVVTYLAQLRGGAVQGLVELSLPLRFANMVVSYAKYVLSTFWPVNLGVYYPFSPADMPVWQPIAAFLFLVFITVIVVRQASQRPYLIVGWLWFLGTLVPVIGLVQVGGQAMADRYHYIPSIGLFIALVFTIADFFSARQSSRTVRAAFAIIVLVIMSTLTWRQIDLWRDSVSLFTHTLSVTSDNLPMEYNLAYVLGRQGKSDEAIAHFNEALRINPNYYHALVNLGITLADRGKLTEAMRCYEQSLQVNPNSAKAHAEMGLVLGRQEKFGEALPHFYKSLEIAPNEPLVRMNLGWTLALLNKHQEAVEHLNEALRLNPNSAETHNNLGLVLMSQGKLEESRSHFSTALQLKPDLGVAQENLKRVQAAIATQQKRNQ